MLLIQSKEPAQDAAQKLAEYIKEAEQQSQPILLHLAGGSAFAVFDYIPFDLQYTNITCAVTDERITSSEDDNNFSKLSRNAWFIHAEERGMNSIDTSWQEGDIMEIAAERFEKELRKWHQQHPEGVVVGLFGIGTDGHTAGIIPGCMSDAEFKERFCADAWVAPLDALGVNQHARRITLTATYISKYIDTVVVYAVGEDKKPILERLQKMEGEIETFPALLLAQHEKSIIVTD